MLVYWQHPNHHIKIFSIFDFLVDGLLRVERVELPLDDMRPDASTDVILQERSILLNLGYDLR